MSFIIDRIEAIRVWDSRGFPTIETSIYLQNSEIFGKAIAPSGASKGKHEALEKRDNQSNIYKDVLTAIKLINEKINKYFAGKKINNQLEFYKQFFQAFHLDNILLYHYNQ